MWVKQIACLVLLAVGAQAQAVSLRLCVNSRSHLPVMGPSGGGTVGLLIDLAAQEVGVTVDYYGAPLTRCREEIRAGVADGFPITPYAPEILSFVAFPLKNAGPDPARATVVIRTVAFRKAGAPVQWNGKQFVGLSKPVLSQFGSLVVSNRLASLGVPMDDKGKSLDANFEKLLAGRGDIVIGMEAEGQALLRKPQFAGKIEALPAAFSDESYYLSLSKQFVSQHGDTAEQLWNAIGRIQRSPKYLDAVKALLEAAAEQGETR